MKYRQFFFALLLSCSATSVWAQTQWEFRAPLRAARVGVAATELDGQIYVLGGQDRFGNVLDAASRYDPGIDQWTELPAMRTSRVHAAAVTFEGKVYVLGGQDESGRVLKEVEFYDPAENRWQSFESMDEERQGLTAVLRKSNIFVAGGSNAQEQILDTIEFYDTNQGSWVEFEGEEDDGGDDDDDGDDDGGGGEVEVTGAIEALDASSITVGGTTFVVADSTEILDGDNNAITLSDLAVGMVVEVRGERNADDVLVATRIRVEDDDGDGDDDDDGDDDGGGGEVEVTGAIEALDASSITVGGTTFVVADSTEILDGDNNAITLSDLAVGMVVEVRGERNADDVLVATRIRVEDDDGDGDDDGGDDGGNTQGKLEFCQGNIDLNIGDTFNIRDYVRIGGSNDPVDWSQVFFTYTEAGANDPTVPPDWNLSAFNAGTPVTVVSADTAAGTGNQGRGQYRVYVVRQGEAAFDDDVTFRIDDERDSEAEDARCDQGGGTAASKGASFGNLGIPRASFAAVTLGDTVLYIGGFSRFGPLDLVQRLRPNGTFDFLPVLPVSRGSLAAAAINDTVFVIGGRDANNSILADVQRLAPAAGAWQSMPRLNIARENSVAVAVDGVLYVIGGRDAGGRVLDSVESFGIRNVASELPMTPPDFYLDQNYPNPFRSGTTITFSVSAQPSSRRVMLSIYDIRGRRVATLIDGMLAPGMHQVRWEGRGQGGMPLSSGVYFYRLQQGDLAARKMMAIIH
ncbi:MAG: DUF5666 domain-containing protein [Rhodothermales bacterium]